MSLNYNTYISSEKPKKRNMNNKAFSLIELLIVIAIIGILSAVALPSYSNYVVKARVSEGLALLSPYKNKISEYYNLNGKFPKDDNASDIGLPVSEGLPSGITKIGYARKDSSKGSIFVKFSDERSELEGTKLYLNCAASGDFIVCECSNYSKADSGTGVPSQYLPGSCVADSSEDSNSSIIENIKDNAKKFN